MEQKDVKSVQELLFNYLKQFELAPVMNDVEVIHWLMPRENIIDTYVVEVMQLCCGSVYLMTLDIIFF